MAFTMLPLNFLLWFESLFKNAKEKKPENSGFFNKLAICFLVIDFTEFPASI